MSRLEYNNLITLYHALNRDFVFAQGGNDSESSDVETGKRQRHISTSSAHSANVAAVTPPGHVPSPASTSQPTDAPSAAANASPNDATAAAVALSRVRTESVCSTMSEAAATYPQREPTHTTPHPMPMMLSFIPQPKPKKTTPRSDESQRIAMAKRDFQQRFNGQQPDKARLTMFDMIFYNPTTNPMKNPAVKSVGVRSRRASNASSVSEAASVARSAISSGGRSVHGGSTSSKGGGGASASAAGVVGRRTSTESNESLVSRSSSSNVSSSAASVKKEAEPPMMMPVPQLKLGPNGEIVLDEKSLVIETTGDKEARATLANAEIVYDDEFSGSECLKEVNDVPLSDHSY